MPQSFTGELALFLTSEKIQKLAAHFALSLVGNFFYGCATIEVIHKAVEVIGLKGHITIEWLNKRHPSQTLF